MSNTTQHSRESKSILCTFEQQSRHEMLLRSRSLCQLFMFITSAIESSGFIFSTNRKWTRFAYRVSSSPSRSSCFVSTTRAMIDKTTMAKNVSIESLKDCGARLRSGELVAFPTETVYGLGCHALDPIAVQKVFAAKERPLSDPLIVHVSDPSDAITLWKADETSSEGRALRALSSQFWPGPLTVVAKAASQVPPIIMANTGYVACRCPSHPLARSLIKEAGVPIAAPSANKFGHVSPTRAHHVWDDLQFEDVWILEEPNSFESRVGVESTVAKVSLKNDIGKIAILRQGAVSASDIEMCLEEVGLGSSFCVDVAIGKTTAEDVPTVAPGQTIRHYAPNVPSYIVGTDLYNNHELSQEEASLLSTDVIVDFGQRLAKWKPHSCAYRDLSASNDSSEAAQIVFETLRWAEQVEGASRILFPEVCASAETDALTLALKDRLTRAASGVVVHKLQ